MKTTTQKAFRHLTTKKYCVALYILLLLCCVNNSLAQVADSLSLSSKQLKEVEIISYPARQSLFTSSASMVLLDSNTLRYRMQPTLVSGFNMVPGVRMEERSPGSYRLSLRGSLLRSPYGVRNVKVYLDEYPLTDGGGNTYLNSIDLSDNSRIEIIKGPDGSLFGANTGGVVHLIPSGTAEASDTEIKVGGGSYGLFTEAAGTSFKSGKHVVGIQQSYYRSDGYRDNSSMHKATVGLSDKWNYSNKAQLKLLLFYSDLYYQTPGGLTLKQEQQDPRKARPATATLPSAAEQHAAVYTQLFFAGIHHDIALNAHLNHIIDVFGSYVDFKNPFITNYETRKENTLGLRSYLEWHTVKSAESSFHATFHLGGEWTNTNADIHNYDNNQGHEGNLQAADKITSQQYFFFARLRMELYNKWSIEGALSLNYAGYHFKEQPPINDHFDPAWMPRIATGYKFSNHFMIRASVSKGYSTPTTAELRPANNLLYLNLQPEYGWNYETGIRANALQQRFTADIAIFHYRLHNAIVSHLDDNGNAFFTNAGGTRQTGLETAIQFQLLPFDKSLNIIQSLSVFNNTTWNAFYFHDYEVDDKDYSGNRLTGVPAIVNVSGFWCDFQKGLSLNATYNHTGKLPLNDANDTYAQAYNLVQIAAGKRFQINRLSLLLNVGIDNLLNETYSLGNDINAAGGRYYNPAAKRNFMLSLKLQF